MSAQDRVRSGGREVDTQMPLAPVWQERGAGISGSPDAVQPLGRPSCIGRHRRVSRYPTPPRTASYHSVLSASCVLPLGNGAERVPCPWLTLLVCQFFECSDANLERIT